jgi:hypothetical protein
VEPAGAEAGAIAPTEAALHDTPAQPGELDGPRVNFYAPAWLRHCPLVHQDGKLNRLTIKLDRPQRSPADLKKFEAAMTTKD